MDHISNNYTSKVTQYFHNLAVKHLEVLDIKIIFQILHIERLNSKIISLNNFEYAKPERNIILTDYWAFNFNRLPVPMVTLFVFLMPRLNLIDG